MQTTRTFTAASEPALWQQVAADMAQQDDILTYSALLQQGPHQVLLDIDIDPGGYETTTLSAVVPADVALRFSLHEQDWVHELGKLLGLQDVQLGYPELDPVFIVQTNNADALRALLADEALRQTLMRFQPLRLSLAPSHHDHTTDLMLRFEKEAGLVEPEQLQEIYHLLIALLQQLTAA